MPGFYLTALGVDSIIGLGVFLLPGQLAAVLGPWSAVAFPVGALLLTVLAVTFARLSHLTSRNGGPYLYASLAFGEKAAFPLGWTDWLGLTVGMGAMGGIVGLLLTRVGIAELTARAIGAGCVLTAGVVNVLGLRYGGRSMVALTVIKVLPLVALAAWGLNVPEEGWLSRFIDGSVVGIPAAELSSAMLMILFTCQGFEIVPAIAGEVNSPRRSVPPAVVLSLWLSVLLYTVLQFGLSAGPAVGSDQPLYAHAGYLWGAGGAAVLQGCALLSVLGLLAGRALVAPRYLTPLCEDGILPRSLAKVHPRYGTPARAIVLTTLIALPWALFAELSQFVSVASLGVSLQYLVSSLALFRISYRDGTGGRGLATAGVLVSLIFLWQIPADAWTVFFVANAVGLLVYSARAVVSNRRRRSLSVQQAGG